MLLGVELGTVTPGLSRTPSVDAALEAVIEGFPELLAALRNNESPLWTGHHTFASFCHGFTRVSTDQVDWTKGTSSRVE
jgi:hypothetical protein